MWDLELQKQGETWSTWRHRNLYFAAVKSTGAPLDFIAEGDDFGTYPFLVAPAYQLASSGLVEKWTRYVEGGGHLILTSRTAQKDGDGHFPEGPLGERLEPLLGARLEGIDTLPGDTKGTVRMGKVTFPWRTWADLLRPGAETASLATYADQFYAGASAAVTRRLGRGSVTYIGVETLEGALERDLVRQVYERAQVPIEDLPRGVYVEWRDGFFVGVNYSASAVDLPIGKDSRIHVGSNPLEPAHVLVWKDTGKP
jgi:beta-galactosidase